MELFQKGKSLDDLETVPDKEVEDFYDKLTFKVLIPLYEETILMSKHVYPSKKLLSMLLKLKNFIVREDRDDLYGKKNRMSNMMTRFRNYLKSNKETKDIDIFFTENGAIFEYSGNYTNIHYEFSKIFAALLGVIGLKIKKIVHLKKYARFDLDVTDLAYDADLRVQERKNLMVYNLDQFIKLENIIDDKTHHLWIHTSASKEAIISFRDFKTGLKYLNSMIQKLPHEERKSRILKIFEHFHWLAIDDEKSLSYRIILPKEEHKLEYSLMNEILLETNITA